MARSIEYLAANGETAHGVAKDWGSVAPSALDSEKRWIRNNGDVALVNLALELTDPLINGGVGIFKHALDTVAVRPPYGGAAVEGAAGGTFSAVRWYFRVTRTNAVGETQGSVEFSCLVTDTTKKINLSWVLPGGPAGTGVKAYASLTSGVYTTPALIATLGAAVTSFAWDGTTPGAGALPAANTTASVTGPNYGTAPTLVVTDLAVGALAVGEARAFWKGYAAPSSAGDETYVVDTHPEET